MEWGPDYREGESEKDKNARLIEEYIVLANSFKDSSIKDLESNLRNRSLVERRRVPSYRRFLEIGDYIKGLTGEQILEIVDQFDLDAMPDLVKDTLVYQELERTKSDIEEKYSQLQSKHRDLETMTSQIELTNQRLEEERVELNSNYEELMGKYEELLERVQDSLEHLNKSRETLEAISLDYQSPTQLPQSL